MRKVLYLAAVSIILVGMVQAAGIDVSPSHLKLEPTPGSTVNRTLSVTWNGDSSTVVSASTEIIPESGENSEGINVTHYPKYKGLYPGDTYEFTIEIDTSVALKPATYTFETTFETSQNVESSSSSSSSVDTSGYELVKRSEVEERQEVIENQSREIKRLRDETGELSDRLDEERDVESNLSERVSELQGLVESMNRSRNVSYSDVRSGVDFRDSSSPVLGFVLLLLLVQVVLLSGYSVYSTFGRR